MNLNQIIKDIKSLKIQGAESVAESSLKALKIVVLKSKKSDPKKLEKEVQIAKKRLEETRPTEPYMRNVLNSVFYESYSDNIRIYRENLLRNIQFMLMKMKKDKEHIVEIGSHKIPNNSIVYTHCSSSTVIGIIKKAHKSKKIKFVHNTETRPRFQGRKTANELSDAGIKVRHYVDSAMRLAIKKADIVLLGCDAFTAEGKVINKIGSELVAETAHRRNVPVYICTNSLKFDPKTIFGFEEIIEEREPEEVWKKPPKNVIIDNHAFEKINPNLIAGIITELGIYKPHILVEEVKRNYPWIL